MQERLESLRAEIDALDAQLVALFEKRLAVCAEIGEEKRLAGLPALDAARERAVLASRLAQVRSPQNAPYVERWMQAVMALCREAQERLINGED